MHTTLYTGVCLCYLKQLCKSYKLSNKHNKGVELSDVISSENLYNVQNRDVKGIDVSVCAVHYVVLIYVLLSLQLISKHKFKFTEVAKCESRVSSTAIKDDHSKLATATTGCHWRRLLCK